MTTQEINEKAKLIKGLMDSKDIIIFPRDTDKELVMEFWDNNIAIMVYNLEMEQIN